MKKPLFRIPTQDEHFEDFQEYLGVPRERTKVQKEYDERGEAILNQMEHENVVNLFCTRMQIDESIRIIKGDIDLVMENPFFDNC